MSYETFLRDLTQHEALDEGRARSEAERERYRALFLLAPAAYLVTDPAGAIRDANVAAVALLGLDDRFVAGKPLASFVDAGERSRFRLELARLAGQERGEWRLRLRPPDRDPVTVAVSVAVGRDHAGRVRELRWLLWPPPEGPAAAGPDVLAPDLEDLTATLHEVVEAASRLVGADGAGLMLVDPEGALRWVTATGEAEQAFERAQRDQGEGPCIDAFADVEVVNSSDLRADPRWPRLAPAVAGNRIRAVLAVPVRRAGATVGTCNVIMHAPRGWTDADVAAVAAFAAVLGRLLASTLEARHKGDLVAQLQTALESRILVEQAKGMLMEREGLSARAAFDRLRRQARSRSRKLDDVAREVIADRPPRGR